LSSSLKESVLKYDTAVKVWDFKEPAWRWGDEVWGYKATLCNLILTDKRLIIVKVRDEVETGRWLPHDLLTQLLLTGAEKGVAGEVNSSDLDHLKGEVIPLRNIIAVEGKRYWKNISGAYYLRIEYQSKGEERYKSIIFGEGFKDKGEWVKEITEAKKHLKHTIDET